MYRKFTEVAPLGEPITAEDVGQTALYLSSEMAAKTTGEVVFVDSGYNILGITEPVDEILSS